MVGGDPFATMFNRQRCEPRIGNQIPACTNALHEFFEYFPMAISWHDAQTISLISQLPNKLKAIVKGAGFVEYSRVRDDP